jgi:hypothetical protein
VSALTVVGSNRLSPPSPQQKLQRIATSDTSHEKCYSSEGLEGNVRVLGFIRPKLDTHGSPQPVSPLSR